MTDQEIYDLSQTGDEVQSILDKGAALPSNPELQEALSGKQDVIPDLSTIRQNAQKGQVAYEQQATVVQQAAQAVEAATDAEHEAQLAQAAALAAAGKLEDLETFLQGLDPESAASVAAALGLFKIEVENDYAKKTECVFDISAYHATGTPPVLAIYADLTAALGTDGDNVPEALRKGGMSVKFVQGTEHTSDNKYVQWRYMSSSTAVADFTNTANWQGVEDEPTPNSDNLVTSGGVEKELPIFKLSGQGQTAVYSSKYTNCKPGNIYRFYINNPDVSVEGVIAGEPLRFRIYTKNEENESTILVNVDCRNLTEPLSNYYDVVIPLDAVSLRIGCRCAVGSVLSVQMQDITQIAHLNRAVGSDASSYKDTTGTVVNLSYVKLQDADGNVHIYWVNAESHQTATFTFSTQRYLVIDSSGVILIRALENDLKIDDIVLLMYNQSLGDFIGGDILAGMNKRDIDRIKYDTIKYAASGSLSYTSNSISITVITIYRTYYGAPENIYVNQEHTQETFTFNDAAYFLVVTENNEIVQRMRSRDILPTDFVLLAWNVTIEDFVGGALYANYIHYKETHPSLINRAELVELVAGRLSTSSGAAASKVMSDEIMFKNFITPNYISVKDIELVSISDIDANESYSILCYAKDLSYLGYLNTIDVFPDNTEYIKIWVHKDTAYSSRSKVITLNINSNGSIQYRKNGFANQLRWLTYEVTDINNIYPQSASYAGTQERLYNNGFVILPPNYSHDGEPVPIAIFVHGTTGYSFGESEIVNYETFLRFVAKNGYAVCDCSSLTNKYGGTTRIDGTTNTSINDTNYPCALSLECYLSLYKKLVSEYNVEPNRVYVWGKSSGGRLSTILGQTKSLPVRCAATFNGSIDSLMDIRVLTSPLNQLSVKTLLIEVQGFPTPPADYPTSGTKEANSMPSDVIDYFMDNLDKFAGYNPIWIGNNGVDVEAFERRQFQLAIGTDLTSVLNDTTLNTIINNGFKTCLCPIKLWAAEDDENVPYAMGVFFSKLVKNGGGICELRTIPAGYGKHWAVDTAPNNYTTDAAPKVDYVTKFGETINITVAYAELVDWFERW